MRRLILGMAAAVALAGCILPGKHPATAPVSPTTQAHPHQADPAPAPVMYVNLEVHRIFVPAGTVSCNEAFWKIVNEQVVNVATYDLLFRNGMRVGVAPTADWDKFTKLLSDYPTDLTKTTFVPGQTLGGEIEMSGEIASQTIFYFDSTNSLTGRTYDRCQNILSFACQSVTYRAGSVRVAVCPLVRSMRRRWVYSPLNTGREVEYVHPEQLYDLNLRVDIPYRHFLIIAPSAEAKWPTNLGKTFLVKDEGADRTEQILLIHPKLYPIEGNSRPTTENASP